ncbi:hypothetical protein MAN_07204, partial [Metarhizium hybridum]
MSIALAVQGIQAAPAVRNNNIERRDSVIQRAEKIPVSYPGGYKKRDNSRLSDNSLNKKDKPTLAAESTSSSGSAGSTASATKPSRNSGSDKGSTALAVQSTNNCDGEVKMALPQALSTSVPRANANANAATRTPEEEKAVQGKEWSGAVDKAA